MVELNQSRIFLCHASEDREIVKDYYHRLKTKGLNPWLDKIDILPGQNWRVEIPKAMRSSAFCIIFLSEISISKRGYVQKEFKLALDVLDEIPEGQIFLIPARLETCEIPEKFREIQYVDLFEPEGFEQVVKTIVSQQSQPAIYQEKKKLSLNLLIRRTINVLQVVLGGLEERLFETRVPWIRLAWICFVCSMFLPPGTFDIKYDVINTGWKAVTFGIFFPLMQLLERGKSLSWDTSLYWLYTLFLGCSNILFVLSPVYVVLLKKTRLKSLLLPLLMVGSAFCISFYPLVTTFSPRIGWYVWCLSFVLVAIGLWSVTLKKRRAILHNLLQ